MFGDENTVREVEEALARHTCQPAGVGFGSFFDLDQLSQHVQTLKMNIQVSGLPQQCKSLFAMESPARPAGVEGTDRRSKMETDDHDAYFEQKCCSHGDDEEAGLLNIPVSKNCISISLQICAGILSTILSLKYLILFFKKKKSVL